MSLPPGLHAFGSDRLEPLGEGRVAIVCRQPKGWVARKVSGVAHRADHPGTAVFWNGAHWEVVAVETRSAGGLTYVLAPWDDAHVFRVMDRYDEEAERERAEERRREAMARGHRGVLSLLAPLAGLLPEEDQLALDYRLGVPATRMTFLSAFLLLIFGTYCVVMLMASGLGGAAAGLPLWVLLLGDYLFIESFARLVVVMAQSRPIGSVLAFPWMVVKALRAPRRPRAAREPDERERRIERERVYHALQPVLGLLSDGDQELLRGRFGFDAVSWGRTTARILAGIGLLFAGSAAVNLLAGARRPGELVWLLLGAALLAEQRSRLARLRAGRPAGSVLGRLVRTMARPLLQPDPEEQPRQTRSGEAAPR